MATGGNGRDAGHRLAVTDSPSSERHLKLLPSPPLPGLGVGAVVVYASHGIGQVVSTRPAGAEPETITLGFASGLTVILPIARALTVLRPLSSAADLDDVGRTLRAVVIAPDETPSRRSRRTREKVASGQAVELAEVVRDGRRREQLHGKGASGALAPGDREVYLHARALLIAEIALSRRIELAEAEAWMLDQIDSPP